MRSRSSNRFSRPSAQRGVALVIALVLLVLMTLLGLTSMRGVALEERMTGNTYDRSLSFQAAESALREAEALVEANRPTPAALAACVNGICGSPNPADLERWLDPAFPSPPNPGGWQAATQVSNGPISLTPQYIVEYLGDTFPCQPGNPASTNDCKRYRITARSAPGGDRSVVMLQSVFATD
ncbi:pilus assembly protein [Hydrogenophaga crocea]|uniref:Pilus assembly protein n=1 Tax=Hydrogenophaga crocea TaxID=2716225 RepID=A0A6G8IDY3_9BURK|nr:pilus assembly protein [Hydrogenophaga crocea]